MSDPVDHPASRRVDLSDTRCGILSVAERLFREIGYRKTTVADIAKSLRMSPANVYRFFESKAAINEAVALRILDEMEEELSAIVARPGVSAAERLAEFVRAHNRLSTERFTSDRRLHEMVEIAIAESWPVIRRHIDSMDSMLCRLVAEGARSGEFAAADPMVAARCVHAAILRFVHPVLIVQCMDDPGPTLDEMIGFLLRGLSERSWRPDAAAPTLPQPGRGS